MVHPMSSPAPERDEYGDASGPPELDELWSWGAASSRAMAERVSAMYRGLASSTFRIAEPELDGELTQLRVDVERLADLSFDVFDRLLAIVGSIADGARRPTGSPEAVCLRATEGETASADIWVHNVSIDSHPAPRLDVPGLTSADGRQIPAERIRLTAAATPIEAGNSRRFTLAVDVPSSTPSGAYHGVLISDASIGTAMLVRVDVVPSGVSAADAH